MNPILFLAHPTEVYAAFLPEQERRALKVVATARYKVRSFSHHTFHSSSSPPNLKNQCPYH